MNIQFKNSVQNTPSIRSQKFARHFTFFFNAVTMKTQSPRANSPRCAEQISRQICHWQVFQQPTSISSELHRLSKMLSNHHFPDLLFCLVPSTCRYARQHIDSVHCANEQYDGNMNVFSSEKLRPFLSMFNIFLMYKFRILSFLKRSKIFINILILNARNFLLSSCCGVHVSAKWFYHCSLAHNIGFFTGAISLTKY